MPSAAEVVGADRARFVLNARPDLIEPLAPRSGPSWATTRRRALDTLGRDEPANLGALQLVIVGRLLHRQAASAS